VTCTTIPGSWRRPRLTVHRLSGGRFALGVGTGEGINERPLGWEFPVYEERAARMAEALSIIRRLLAGEKLDFDGEHYRTRAAKLYSPPVGHAGCFEPVRSRRVGFLAWPGSNGPDGVR
jgi:Luciferase-like monooxygenase